MSSNIFILFLFISFFSPQLSYHHDFVKLAMSYHLSNNLSNTFVVFYSFHLHPSIYLFSLSHLISYFLVSLSFIPHPLFRMLTSISSLLLIFLYFLITLSSSSLFIFSFYSVFALTPSLLILYPHLFSSTAFFSSQLSLPLHTSFPFYLLSLFPFCLPLSVLFLSFLTLTQSNIIPLLSFSVCPSFISLPLIICKLFTLSLSPGQGLSQRTLKIRCGRCFRIQCIRLATRYKIFHTSSCSHA